MYVLLKKDFKIIGVLKWNKAEAKITKLLLRNAISNSPCWPFILRDSKLSKYQPLDNMSTLI